MATTTAAVSAWAKPGAWALDSEEHEKELIQQEKKEGENGHPLHHFNHQQPQQEQQPLSDFPTLSAAVLTTKTTKKKKNKTVPLYLFTTGQATLGSANSASSSQVFQVNKGLTTNELLALPTGPRERSAEELDRGRLGGGFRSYGEGQGRNSRYSSNGGEDSSTRWGSDESRRGGGGFNRDRESNRDSGPSRADETDDWGAAKKSSMVGSSFERRDRGERGERGGFFDSQSRADESDSWVSNKSHRSAALMPRRVGSSGGFENRERRGGFEFQKETSNGGGAGSDTWGKKREEGTVTARPKLVLQPRTLSPSNGEQEPQPESGGSTVRSKGSNPFGEARPREEVLAEKGQDWKKIDKQLESVKIIKETDDGSSFGKKAFGNGNGRVRSPEGRTERSWRKAESVDVAPPPSAEIAVEDEGGVAEN